jgi:hypothetical protein
MPQKSEEHIRRDTNLRAEQENSISVLFFPLSCDALSHENAKGIFTV